MRARVPLFSLTAAPCLGAALVALTLVRAASALAAEASPADAAPAAPVAASSSAEAVAVPAEPSPPGAANTPVATPAPEVPGMKVNIDPATGRFLDTPAPDAPPSADATQAPAAEPAPIALEPSPVPGGGVGFRVPDGRFDTELKAGPRDGAGGGYDIHCDEPAR